MCRVYDFIVIGGGSAGVHTAFFLHQFGAKVALVERCEIAAGGSGAAGAFVSPRLGKGGPIQRYTNEAFRFCLDFYKKSNFFYQTGLLRLPKEGEDFNVFEPFLDVGYEKKDGGFFFPEAGLVKAKEHLLALAQNVDCYYFDAKIERKDDYFKVGNLKAKKVVLATGSDDELIDDVSIKIGKVGGVRFDLQTTLQLPYSMHKKISISANIDGVVAIGATHNRANRPSQPPSVLFDEAKKMVGEFDYRLKQMYCGVRSSVNDHLPIIGYLVDFKEAKEIKDYRSQPLPRRDIAIINGLGGRGFVFGPYAANLLARHLLFNEALPKDLDVARYYIRYRRRSANA